MILVTGGAGYIGSHTCVSLLQTGEQVVVFDNFSNSSPAALRRVQQICGKPLIVVEGDIRDQTALEKVFLKYRCTAVMHFAGLKSVQESVAQPLEYYDHNVVGSHRLLRAMQRTGVKTIVFSSSATVEPLMENEQARFDATKFSWIGSMNQEINFCGIWQRPGAPRSRAVLVRMARTSPGRRAGLRSMISAATPLT